MPTARPRTTDGKGPAIDAGGGPVIDPTANVRDLVAAESRRQDDLRCVVDEHARELRGIVANYEDKLRFAESARLDSIRMVDVKAVERAAEESKNQAAVLATQVATSAETLRNQVAAAAAASATALAAALEPLIKAIDELRKTQYQQQGEKSQKVEGKDNNQWIVGVGITLLGIVVTLLGVCVTWIVLHK